MNWKTAGNAPLEWRCWDGDYVIFCPLSGHTHILDVLAGEIIKAVIARPSSEDELCARVAAFLDVDNDERVSTLVRDALAKLQAFALIEPTVP